MLTSKPENTAPEGGGPRSPWMRRWAWVVAANVLCLATILLTGPSCASLLRSSPRATAAERAAAFQVVLVDDAASIVDDKVADAKETTLPRGISLPLEHAYLGPGESRAAHFARIARAEGETMEAARARLLAWVKTLDLPPGDRVALEEVKEYIEEQDRIDTTGWRTYLLRGAPVLTGADVDSAYPESSSSLGGWKRWAVRITLNAEGAARFEQVTSANVKRRMAFLVHGDVVSAPVIQQRISGGKMTITVDGSSGLPCAAEQEEADAMRVIHILNGDYGAEQGTSRR